MPIDPNTDPNTDIERETTGEPYVEGNIETDTGVAPGGTSVEGLDAEGADTPDSLAMRVQKEEHRIYPLALEAICHDKVKVEGRRVRKLN